MAREVTYCGCGRDAEYGNLCERCSNKWDDEQSKITEYVNTHSLSYDDEQEIKKEAWDRMGLGSRTVRYCDYHGSCGTIIEDGAEYCPSCTQRQQEYEREEERRRRAAIDDY